MATSAGNGERRKPSDDELRGLSKHLLYEIEMFGATVGVLAAVNATEASNARTTMRNALLESWALHVRNLLSFLYDDRAGKGDAIAADYIGADWRKKRGAKPDVLRLAHAQASKQVAHMSYLRAELSEAQQQWHPAPIIVALGRALHAFVDAVPETLVIDAFHERARRIIPSRDAPLNLHGQEVVSGATEASRNYGPSGKR